jgi:hypothetical protein
MLVGFFSTLALGFSAPETSTGEPARETIKQNASAGSLQPTPTPTSTPKPTPKPAPKPTPDEEEEEIRRNHRFLGEPARAMSPARTRMFIGREVPVPTQYNAPRITQQANGGYVIQPSTPTSFEIRRTGVTIDNGGFEQTELEGFINYGSPIRTVVPMYNEKGEIIGTTVQEYPNPILQPVFRTIRQR